MKNAIEEKIAAFLTQPAFAVAGASSNRDKYGNKVVRVYQQKKKLVYPIHPTEKLIEGLPTVPDVRSVPAKVFALSIVTPPKITFDIVRQGLLRGVLYFWMQPGAENAEAIAEAEAKGAIVIHGGPCVLATLGYREAAE